MKTTDFFIEKTFPDFSYKILWIGETIEEGLEQLVKIKDDCRLELWSRAYAATDKGFAPMAFRDKNSNRVMIGSMIKMLLGKQNELTNKN